MSEQQVQLDLVGLLILEKATLGLSNAQTACTVAAAYLCGHDYAKAQEALIEFGSDLSRIVTLLGILREWEATPIAREPNEN